MPGVFFALECPRTAGGTAAANIETGTAMAKLILSMDGLVLKEIALDKERISIGRKPDNDIQIDNLAISGHHAVITRILNDSFLEDQNSTNGTYVNGQPVKKHVLHHNDIVELGKYRIKYLVEAVPNTPNSFEMIETSVLKPFEMSLTQTDIGIKPATSETQIMAAGALERAEQAVAANAGRVGVIRCSAAPTAGAN